MKSTEALLGTHSLFVPFSASLQEGSYLRFPKNTAPYLGILLIVLVAAERILSAFLVIDGLLVGLGIGVMLALHVKERRSIGKDLKKGIGSGIAFGLATGIGMGFHRGLTAGLGWGLGGVVGVTCGSGFGFWLRHRLQKRAAER